MQCPNCHAGRSHFLVIRERGRTTSTSIKCLACNTPDITPVYADTDTTAQRFTPIVLDVSLTDGNKFSFPGSSTDAVPAGYRRVEITNLREADQWTKKIDSVERQTGLAYAAANREYFDQQRAERRANIDAEMSRTGMDRSGRARFLRDAARKFVDATEERKRARQISGGPNFNMQVISYDQQNRMDYSRDGRERGRKA